MHAYIHEQKASHIVLEDLLLSLGALDQYIVCHSCNTWSTVLEDSDDKRRLLLLRCVECDHSRKVPEIKAYKGCRGLKVGRVKPNDKKD